METAAFIIIRDLRLMRKLKRCLREDFDREKKQPKTKQIEDELMFAVRAEIYRYQDTHISIQYSLVSVKPRNEETTSHGTFLLCSLVWYECVLDRG